MNRKMLVAFAFLLAMAGVMAYGYESYNGWMYSVRNSPGLSSDAVGFLEMQMEVDDITQTTVYFDVRVRDSEAPWMGKWAEYVKPARRFRATNVYTYNKVYSVVPTTVFYRQNGNIVRVKVYGKPASYSAKGWLQVGEWMYMENSSMRMTPPCVVYLDDVSTQWRRDRAFYTVCNTPASCNSTNPNETQRMVVEEGSYGVVHLPNCYGYKVVAVDVRPGYSFGNGTAYTAVMRGKSRAVRGRVMSKAVVMRNKFKRASDAVRAPRFPKEEVKKVRAVVE